EDPDAAVPADSDPNDDFRVESATGVEKIRRLVHITQKPIGRTVRSTVATYTGLFDHVRRLFADTPEAKQRGMSVSVLSYTTRRGENIRRLVHSTQKPIGRTVRSSVATYTRLFDHVRRLFADTPEAKQRGMSVSDFSYNTTKGRCPECDGAGSIEVELVFLPGT